MVFSISDIIAHFWHKSALHVKEYETEVKHFMSFKKKTLSKRLPIHITWVKKG
jgi:hypothetical protein